MLPLPGRHRKDCLAVRPLGKYRDDDVFPNQPAVELGKIYAKAIGLDSVLDFFKAHSMTKDQIELLGEAIVGNWR